jgi:hypothetical protein
MQTRGSFVPFDILLLLCQYRFSRVNVIDYQKNPFCDSFTSSLSNCCDEKLQNSEEQDVISMAEYFATIVLHLSMCFHVIKIAVKQKYASNQGVVMVLCNVRSWMVLVNSHVDLMK